MIKRKKDNFSDKDLKSLEDKSLIINTNQRINLQSIIGRFADYKFQNKFSDEKIDYYKKAYGYNAFVLRLIENREIKNSISSLIFDNNKNNFLKCLDYVKYLEINEDKIAFIEDLSDYFSLSSSPNNKILEKLEILSQSVEDKIRKDFFTIQSLDIDYFYGNFDFVYQKIQEQYPLNEKIKNIFIENKIERRTIFKILSLYGMEGYQYEEVKVFLNHQHPNSSLFEIGEYIICEKLFEKTFKKNEFFKYEEELNTNNLDIKLLKKYIENLYKTQFIDKMQSSYTLLKADKSEITLKDIRKLIIINPFTDGLKTLMLAIKDEKNCSKEMYEEAIKKLFHIKYYYVEAILLYCEYLKEKNDENYQIWFADGKSLATKHYYRYLLHRFNCLENGLNISYDENNYPLPEKLDYSQIIKKYEL